MRHFFSILLTLCSFTATADEINLIDSEENDIAIQVSPAEGDLLMIWLLDHDQQRPLFDTLLQNIVKAGIEVWRVDLLQAYFMPRSSENIRTLDGNGVEAVLTAAHKHSNKRILLASYDRMPLPLLRGVRQWQAQTSDSRLSGALLFYPNLFGPPPIAGEAPVADPILYATNIPLAIFQPALGSHRWRMDEILSALWQTGSASYLYLVPGVRDWFFMGEGDDPPTEEEQHATDLIPEQIKQFAKLFESHPKPSTALPMDAHHDTPRVIRSLEQLKQPKPGSSFTLSDIHDQRFDSHILDGKVVLLNFWATWCPPCVEEIPSLNRLNQLFKDNELRIVSIDFRETPEEMSTFLKQIPVDFPVLMDRDGLVSMDWQVFSFPSSFIIDRQGQIRYSANRAISWDSTEVVNTLNNLLTEQAPTAKPSSR
ncbi:MAG: TlpA disulfide reductase family protein [Candidatus Thiodiazotropha sp. 6PLUC9]